MYNDDVTRTPATTDELWEVLGEQFEFVRHVLSELHVETEEEALGICAQRKPSRDAMSIIRYRSIGEQYNQREYFLKMGRELLPYIDQALEKRKLTRRFVQQWGKIMFCHGYIASFVFDDGDDVSQKRGGLKGASSRSRRTQRKWLSHLILKVLDGEKTSRKKAVARVEAYLGTVIAGADYPPGFDADWFKPIITRGGLASTYDEKHFSLRQMRKLVCEPTDDIPPIPPKVP